MAKRKIFTYGNPILRQKAQPITEITQEIEEIINDMIETMYEAPGIGLASNQIGIAKQIIVIDMKVKNPQSKAVAILNPKITASSGEYICEEGCLSFPEINIDVKRFSSIKVQGMNINGERIEFEENDLVARIFQHEIDHLNGILFIDHINFVRKQLLRKDLKKLEELSRSKKE
ncbi:MAG: peptide deformylase [Candidatus Firestonebacteria bacterium]|nr:peptide deformylase [Candidatus Firestonebacteria bacterium]